MTVVSGPLELRVDYHSPDRAYSAVLLRDGAPWYLDGALVGMGADPGAAVEDLTRLAMYLIVHGSNFLAPDLAVDDREWLRGLFEPMGDPSAWLESHK